MPPGPSESFTLPPGEVHVWQLSLSLDDRTVTMAWHTLSADERERAERFLLERVRRKFILARGQLRALLGRYTSVEPHGVQFEYGRDGKPELAGEAAASGLRFNLSHSGHRAFVALACGVAVGVDIELIRDTVRFERIAARFFSPFEAADLMALPDAERLEGFFRIWTCKEAYLKGRGIGLGSPLDQFDVRIPAAAGQGAAMPVDVGLIDRGDPAAARFWRLQIVWAPAGYVGALAVAASDSPVMSRFWSWDKPV